MNNLLNSFKQKLIQILIVISPTLYDYFYTFRVYIKYLKPRIILIIILHNIYYSLQRLLKSLIRYCLNNYIISIIINILIFFILSRIVIYNSTGPFNLLWSSPDLPHNVIDFIFRSTWINTMVPLSDYADVTQNLISQLYIICNNFTLIVNKLINIDHIIINMAWLFNNTKTIYLNFLEIPLKIWELCLDTIKNIISWPVGIIKCIQQWILTTSLSITNWIYYIISWPIGIIKCIQQWILATSFSIINWINTGILLLHFICTCELDSPAYTYLVLIYLITINYIIIVTLTLLILIYFSDFILIYFNIDKQYPRFYNNKYVELIYNLKNKGFFTLLSFVTYNIFITMILYYRYNYAMLYINLFNLLLQTSLNHYS